MSKASFFSVKSSMLIFFYLVFAPAAGIEPAKYVLNRYRSDYFLPSGVRATRGASFTRYGTLPSRNLLFNIPPLDRRRDF
jgi:hypothetical protein